MALVICAVISGAETWLDVYRYGESKKGWLKTFLELPHGIPSHDTIGRVFAALDPESFRTCFTAWVKSLGALPIQEVIAIDGKTLRRSFDRASQTNAIHMVSAWACEKRLVLGQIKTEEKSNEITAIPKLLDQIDVAGSIVTTDAMGCQRDIVEKIVEKGADYVLHLKGNQGTMHEDVKLWFEWASENHFKDTPCSTIETFDYGHGRTEQRRYYLSSQVEWFEHKAQWKNLTCFGMVESDRTINGQTQRERRFYISSLPSASVALFAKAVRSHWAIENSLHWILDVTFREDENRVRKNHAPENFAMIRHLALNLLKQESTSKESIKGRRKICGWDNSYLCRVLGI
jgi:predicted transposase YbfD/YdcC